MVHNNKFLITAMAIFATALTTYGAETLNDLQFPKPPAYRVGISEIPEKQYIQAKEERKEEKISTKLGDIGDEQSADLTYADLSIKRLSKEIAQELEYEESDMVADLSLLWQGAATQSDTINFALYKLANPDADKPDSKSLKNILTTIASMSTLVGASISNPMLAGSSLIGGNILGIMSQDTKALNYKYTKVNDADMIILVRKIEDLQQTAVNLYYDYLSSRKQLNMMQKLVEERKRKFELAQKNNAQRELIVISDAYYRTAMDKYRTSKSEFFAKRAALEQFVGNQTFVQFEAELNARESGEKPSNTISPEDEQEYKQTVQRVETYTKDLQNTDSDENAQDIPTPEQNMPENPQNIKADPIPVYQDNSDKKDTPISNNKKTKHKTKNAAKDELNTMPMKKKVIELKDIPQKTDKKINTNKFLPLDEIKMPSREGEFTDRTEGTRY